jgi:glycosyltransferase involved in cell wall biosynthesis
VLQQTGVFDMQISGFSFVRNGVKLYYPVAESIKSILPICDEFMIAVGKGDEDDTTREAIEAIGNPKIKVIDTEWDEEFFKRGIINALQTDIAKARCTGDWLFYLQADEVVHEDYLPVITARCEELLNRFDVEGLLFGFRHFWGDYWHYHIGHGWYPYEIRIIRNLPQVHSYQSAQSFRHFEEYDNPRQAHGTRKLRVARVDAEIYHYGWVRPPHLMQNKRRALDTVHWGHERAAEHYDEAPRTFDYGPLDRLARFDGAHPAVMKQRIEQMDWQDQLQQSGRPNRHRAPHKHERLKYRFLTYIEKRLLGGKQIGTFKNYTVIDGI